jgi:trehalose 6-phosphate phosphatase
VLYLLEALGLNRDDVMPLYLGDDVTDEYAFEALANRGVGIFVGHADAPGASGTTTAAHYILHTTEEVRQFLDTLAR